MTPAVSTVRNDYHGSAGTAVNYGFRPRSHLIVAGVVAFVEVASRVQAGVVDR